MLGFIRNFLAALIVFLPFIAKADNIQNLTYDVYAGGFRAVEANLTIDLSQKGLYSIDLQAETQGFLGALVPWSGGFESNGWAAKDNTFKPQKHESHATWRGETEVKTYNYNKDGSFGGLIIHDHEKAPEEKEVSKELTDQTVDILTATLSMLQNTYETEECEGYSEIFDGKRRFGLTFEHQKDDTLSSSRYNIYEGSAAKCTVEVTPMGGKWHKKPRGWLSVQEQGREKGTMPTIWVGKVSHQAPSIPVKIFVKTKYGALVMHLTKFEVDGEIIIADKRADEEG